VSQHITQQQDQRKETFLRRAISMGELIDFAITIMTAGIMFYTSTQVRMSNLEIRMSNVENSYKDIKESLQRIEQRQAEAKDELNSIKIQLNNKKDR
jgi:septation ring formation regulator EzrA